MNKILEILYESYNKQFAQNPFENETIEISECLIVKISEQSKKNERNTIKGLSLAQQCIKT